MLFGHKILAIAFFEIFKRQDQFLVSASLIKWRVRLDGELVAGEMLGLKRDGLLQCGKPAEEVVFRSRGKYSSGFDVARDLGRIHVGAHEPGPE